MSKNLKKIAPLLLMLVTLWACSLTTQAAAYYKNLLSQSSKASTFSAYDITNDGKADTITITPTKAGYSYNRIKVFINGKSALNWSTKAPIYSWSVQYLHLTNSREYLYIHGHGDSNMPYLQCIYAYNSSNGQLAKVYDFSSEYFSKSATTIDKVTSKSFRIVCACQPSLVGYVKFSLTYKVSGSTFKRSTSKATVKSTLTYDAGDGYTKYFKKSQFKLVSKTNLLKSAGSSKKAFTAPAGAVLTMKKITVKNNIFYIQFKYKGKTGWLKNYGNIFNTFYGVSRRLAGGFYG